MPRPTRSVAPPRSLPAWADSLQNSDITGQRYLTDKTRRAAGHKKSAQVFFEKVDRMVEEARRARGEPRLRGPHDEEPPA